MKRFVAVLVLLGGLVFSLFAQQSITRFAVVDMNRVLLALNPDREKALNEKREKAEAEIKRMFEEISELNKQLEEAIEANEKSSVIRNLENQAKAKAQALQTYQNNSRAELEKEAAKIKPDEELLKRLNAVLREVAEREGYSIVLSKDAPGIMWYSGHVEITNLVINRLKR